MQGSGANDPEITEKAFRSDAFRASLGWGPKELYTALDEADGFDRRFGTLTSGADWTTPPHNYSPTHERLFRHVMGNLDFRAEQRVFIDAGCGKGRAVLLATDFPFEKCIGVELSPEHLKVAEANLAKYENPARRCADVEFVLANVVTWEPPQKDLFIWFFSSFLERDETAEYVAHLGRSLAAHPRSVILAYVNPMYVEEFENSGFLRRWGKQGLPAKPPFHIRDGQYAYAVFATHDMK